eukprot:967229-Amphidinium_carterae.1
MVFMNYPSVPPKCPGINTPKERDATRHAWNITFRSRSEVIWLMLSHTEMFFDLIRSIHILGSCSLLSAFVVI